MIIREPKYRLPALGLAIAMGLGTAACSSEAPKVSASGPAVPGTTEPTPTQSTSETEAPIDLTDLSPENMWRMTAEQRLEAIKISKESVNNLKDYPEEWAKKVNAVWSMCASVDNYKKMKADNGDPDVYRDRVWEVQRPLIAQLYNQPDIKKMPDSQEDTYSSCAIITAAQWWVGTQGYQGTFTPFSSKTVTNPSHTKVNNNTVTYESTTTINVPDEDRRVFGTDQYDIIPDAVFTKSVQSRTEEVVLSGVRYNQTLDTMQPTQVKSRTLSTQNFRPISQGS